MAVRRIGRVAVRLPCLSDPLSRCQVPQEADVFDYIETGGSSVGLVARPITSPAFRTMTRNHGSEPRVGLVEGTFHGQQQVSP